MKQQELMYCWRGYNSTTTLENNLDLFNKVEMRTPYNLNYIPSYFSRETHINVDEETYNNLHI